MATMRRPSSPPYKAWITGRPSAKSLDCVQNIARAADAATRRLKSLSSPVQIN